MSDAPERIWISKAGVVLLYQGSSNTEYIRKDIVEKEKQDATKNIREIWEEYKSPHQWTKKPTSLTLLEHDLLQAIRADLGEK